MRRSFLIVVAGGIISALASIDVRAQDEEVPERARGRNNVNSRHLLLPPEDAALQDARGSFWLRQNPVRSALVVQACGLESGVTYDVMISAGGETELLGNITTIAEGDGGDGMDGGDGDDEGAGCGKLRLDTKRGDMLPLGAGSVGDLVGAVVDVVDPDGNVVLTTEVVNLEVNTPGKGDGDGGDEPGGDRRGPPEGVPPDRGDRGPDDGEDGGDTGDGGDGGDTGDGGGASLEPPLPEEAFLVAGRHDATFVRGDSNMDGAVNIADPIATLALLFGGGDLPYCLDAADANDDGALNLSDAVMVLGVLFLGEGSVPPPGFTPGFDPTPDALFCDLENDL